MFTRFDTPIEIKGNGRVLEIVFHKNKVENGNPGPSGATSANKSNLDNIVNLIIDTLKIQKQLKRLLNY